MDKLSERLTNEMKSKEQQSRVRIKIKKRNYKKRKPRRKMNCHAALYMTESNSCRVHGLRTHAWGGGRMLFQDYLELSRVAKIGRGSLSKNGSMPRKTVMFQSRKLWRKCNQRCDLENSEIMSINGQGRSIFSEGIGIKDIFWLLWSLSTLISPVSFAVLACLQEFW